MADGVLLKVPHVALHAAMTPSALWTPKPTRSLIFETSTPHILVTITPHCRQCEQSVHHEACSEVRYA